MRKIAGGRIPRFSGNSYTGVRSGRISDSATRRRIVRTWTGLSPLRIVAETFARITGIECPREKLNTFGQTFDHGKAVMIHGPLDHLNHVINLGCVSPGDEGGTGGNQLLDRVNRMIDRPGGIGF